MAKSTKRFFLEILFFLFIFSLLIEGKLKLRRLIKIFDDSNPYFRLIFSFFCSELDEPTLKRDSLLGACQNNCSGKGTCQNDVCNCNPGYTGSDCSIRKPKTFWLKYILYFVGRIDDVDKWNYNYGVSESAWMDGVRNLSAKFVKYDHRAQSNDLRRRRRFVRSLQRFSNTKCVRLSRHFVQI